MIFIYRIIYFFLKYLALIAYPILNQKSKNWVKLRSEYKKSFSTLASVKNPIWVHASSGEIEYAKSVILEIKKQRPDQNIVVTYSSASATRLFENIRDSVACFIPLCWDSPQAVKQLIQQINPKAVIIARTDLWPEMIDQFHQKKIPISLISYFPKLTSLNTLLLLPLWQKIDFISCVDEATAQKIKKVYPEFKNRISVEGDTRYDQVFNRLDQVSKINLIKTKKIFTCGSIWPEDQKELFKIFHSVLNLNYQVILSPHEIDRNSLHHLEDQLRSNSYTFKRLSDLNVQKLNMTFDFLIIDQIGYLADAYRQSDIVFVGGSFKQRVHSVMEPLCCGLPVLTGPYYKNNPEALKYSEPNSNYRFVFPCMNAAELEIRFKQLDSNNLKSKILSEMTLNKGTSLKIAQIILSTFITEEISSSLPKHSGK